MRHARSYLACPFLFALRGDARRSAVFEKPHCQKDAEYQPERAQRGINGFYNAFGALSRASRIAPRHRNTRSNSLFF